MKNLLKLFGIIALIAVIGFTFAACNNGNNPDPDPVPEPKTVILRNLPGNGESRIYLSTAYGNDPGDFLDNFIARGSTMVSGNTGTFQLKNVSPGGEQSNVSYTGTGDFYIGFDFSGNPLYILKTKI